MASDSGKLLSESKVLCLALALRPVGGLQPPAKRILPENRP